MLTNPKHIERALDRIASLPATLALRREKIQLEVAFAPSFRSRVSKPTSRTPERAVREPHPTCPDRARAASPGITGPMVSPSPKDAVWWACRGLPITTHRR
jgi:hypothetical protein